MTFTDVDWDETLHTSYLTYDGGKVTRHTGSGWGNNTGVAKTDGNVFDVDGDVGSIQFTINTLYCMVGLAQNPFQDETYSFADLEFGLYHDAIYESGTEITSDVSFNRTSASDVFKVVLDDQGVVKYYFNGSLVHTSTKTASGTYYPLAAIENTNGEVDVQQEVETTVVNQELKVMFYPEGNVAQNQELKVMFYPNGNVQDSTTTSTGFKWWFGMRGKKKYGRSRIINVRW